MTDWLAIALLKMAIEISRGPPLAISFIWPSFFLFVLWSCLYHIRIELSELGGACWSIQTMTFFSLL